tara:strand:+ start:50 stop:265 length:216 start_codon:yes stop_codon:yes gene_type:complete
MDKDVRHFTDDGDRVVWKTRKGGIFYLEDMNSAHLVKIYRSHLKRNYTMPVIDCVWDELVHRGLDSEFEQE